MSTRLTINDAAYFIPPIRLRVEDNLEYFGLTKAQAKVYSKFYGIEEVPLAKDMTAAELIEKPIVSLLQANPHIRKQDIRYVIHTHTAKVITRFGNSAVNEIKTRLGLSHALVFGTSLNNCASTLDAMEMAEKLLKLEDKDAKAVIVTGERAFTPTLRVIPNTSIMGDASSAILVSVNGSSNRLVHSEMKCIGEYSEGIWLTPKKAKQFESDYVSLLSETILSALHQVQLSFNDIKFIIPHNVNLISWANVAKNLGYPLEKIYLENVKKYAHCFGADIFINYKDVMDTKRLEPQDYYMIATVGLGATFAVAIFQH